MNDAEKIAQVKEIVQSRNTEKVFEIVSSALSIENEEDRDLSLLEAAGWLVENGFWQKAYGAAQLMADSYEKSLALREIADYLASNGHLEKAFSIFTEAEKSAVAENLAAWQKAELLHGIAQSLRRTRAFFKADEVWETAITAAQEGTESANLQDSDDASGVLAEIAGCFAAEGRIEKALETAQKIKNIGRKEKTLQKISAYSEQVKQVA